MKTRFFQTAGVSLATVLGLGLATFSASAATLDIRVNLPYEASVGSVTLPAGEYSIQTMNTNGASALLFRTADGGSVAIATAQAIANNSSGQTRVELQKVGDKYQIDKIFVEGRATGFDLLNAE